jgi:trehalose synthase
VIGGRCGGITLQIEDGRNGYLVDDVETAAARTADLLRAPERASEMGRYGRETVRKQFLSTRELEDWLRLYSELQ